MSEDHGIPGFDMDILIEAAVLAYGDLDVVVSRLGVPRSIIQESLSRKKATLGSLKTAHRTANVPSLNPLIRAARMYGPRFMDWYLGISDYRDMPVEEALKNEMMWDAITSAVVMGFGFSNEDVRDTIRTATGLSRVVEKSKDRQFKEKKIREKEAGGKKDNISWILELKSGNEEDYCSSNPESMDIVK